MVSVEWMQYAMNIETAVPKRLNAIELGVFSCCIEVVYDES